MILGYDLSNYSGVPSVETLVGLRNKYDLRRAILGTQDAAIYQGQVASCEGAGIEYDAYLFLYDPATYLDQLEVALATMGNTFPLNFWLDIEDENSPLPNEAQILAVLEAAQQSQPTGIYTSEGYWLKIGNPNFGTRCPLWLARWTVSPPVEPEGWDAGFGGWVRAPVVQYAGDVTLLGVQLDLDAWSA